MTTPLQSLLLLPITLLSRTLLFLFSPLTLLLTVTYNLLTTLLLLPYRFLVNIKSLYLFTGTALLLGFVLGSVVAVTAYTLTHFLGLHTPPPPSPSPPTFKRERRMSGEFMVPSIMDGSDSEDYGVRRRSSRRHSRRSSARGGIVPFPE